MLGIDPRAARATWTVILVLLLCAIVYAIRQTLFLFVLALLFAYLLLPMVDLLDRRLPVKRSRGPALAIVYILLISVISSIGSSVGTQVAEQANLLAQKIPELLKPERAAQLPLPDALKPLGANLAAFLQEHSPEMLAALPKAVLKAVGAAAGLIFVVIVPILSFFFLKDGRAIQAEILRAAGASRYHGALTEVASDLNILLAQYMRALVLLGLTAAICYGLFFLVMGVPYGMLLAAIAFPLEFIPMIGPLTASVIILAVAGFSGYPHLLAVLAFIIAFRVFQDYVVAPHLMSSGMELHPLLVMFGVFAGEQVAGVAGAFLSVPVLATLRIVYRRVIAPRLAQPPPA